MGNQLTGRSYLQKLQTFAYGTLALPLLFFIYLYLESSVDRLESLVSQDTHTLIFIPALLICAFLFFLSWKKFKILKGTAVAKERFKEKLEIYRKANNFRFVIYGAIAGLCTLGFYLTNYQPFAALFGIMIVLFSINNPTARKIVSDLKLKDKEKQTILTGIEIN
jgi:hypothetical protein